MPCNGDCNQGRECNCKCKMTDIDKFHEWVETQSPLALREYTHAQAAWQARGELDAVRIKELEAKLDKAREALETEKERTDTWAMKYQALRDVFTIKPLSEELDK